MLLISSLITAFITYVMICAVSFFELCSMDRDRNGHPTNKAMVGMLLSILSTATGISAVFMSAFFLFLKLVI